jgi:hypothetical protein
MRSIDIDTSDPSSWVYRPGRHKTEHHERDRYIFLGPKAQVVLRPFLKLDCLRTPVQRCFRSLPGDVCDAVVAWSDTVGARPEVISEIDKFLIVH